MEANQLRFYHALSNFWIFATPACKGTADFRGSFKTYLAQSESTNALIENLTRTRTDVVNLLNSAAPLEQRLRAVDEYLPFLYQFYDSLLAHHANSAGVPLRADKDLVFEWRCYLAPNGGLPHFRSNDIVFELIMTLHLKATLHYFTARHLLDLDLIANLTEAGKQLVTASGILDLIEANIKSNKWNRAHYSAPNVPNPAETSVAVLAGLSLYYRSLAQILAIIKGAANTEKPTPLAVKTRLSVAVINMSASALRSLESASFGGTGKFSAWLNFDLLTKVAVNREVFTALAYFYQSKALQEKQEIGASIAYAQFAQFHLAEQPSAKFNSATAGLPKSTGNFANIAAISAYLNSLLVESINENDRTNRFVTFQVVPKALGELPPLPAEAVIMNSQPFKEPVTEDKQLVLFIPPEKKSFFGSLFSKSKSTSKGEGLAAEQGKAATDTPDTDNSSNPPNIPNPAPLPVVQGQVVPNPSASSPAVYVAPGAFAPAPAPALMSPPSVSSTQTGSGITYPSNSHLYPTLTQHPPNQPMPQPPYTQPYAQPPQPYNAPPNTNYYNAAGAPPALYYNPSAPYATPQVMSDEEYARQLQQQYNQESK